MSKSLFQLQKGKKFPQLKKNFRFGQKGENIALQNFSSIPHPVAEILEQTVFLAPGPSPTGPCQEIFHIEIVGALRTIKVCERLHSRFI